MIPRTREILLTEIALEKNFEYLLFYGARVAADGSISETCCSQWYPAKFTVDGVDYPTAEHFMMAEKARAFRDDESLAKILQSKSPADAKALGRKVRNFDSTLWAKQSFQIVVSANIAKFSQNEKLAAWLRISAPKILVEASPTDKIWGIGMAVSDPHAKDPVKWRGRNLLGFALTRVRDELG